MSVTFFRVRLYVQSLSWDCRIFIFSAKPLSIPSLFGESVFFQKLSLFKQSVPLSSWIRYFFFLIAKAALHANFSLSTELVSCPWLGHLFLPKDTILVFKDLSVFSTCQSQQNLFPRQEVSLCLDCVPAHRVFSSFRARFCLQNLSPVCTVWGGFPGLCLFAGPI